jgi:Flp pilus assembly protein CpaB
MKQKLVPLLGIAFVVALISTGIFYGLFVSRLPSSSGNGRSTIVAAAHDLERGTVIQRADVKTVSVDGPAPKGAFASVQQVVGLTVLEQITANDTLLDSRVTPERAVPVGMRALSIHASDSLGIVSLLHPGFRIDIQVINEHGDATLRTLLQSVEVLAVAGNENGKPVVNVLTTPAQAETLALADSTSRVRLVLRNAADAGRESQGNLPASQLFRTAPAAKAAAGDKMTTLLPSR